MKSYKSKEYEYIFLLIKLENIGLNEQNNETRLDLKESAIREGITGDNTSMKEYCFSYDPDIERCRNYCWINDSLRKFSKKAEMGV